MTAPPNTSPQKKIPSSSHKFIKTLLIAVVCMTATSCFAGGVIVVTKNGRVERKDAETGSYKGMVGASGAVSASTDGVIIGIVYKSGRAKRYDAKTGSYKGAVGESKAKSIQVTSGTIIVTYENGKSKRYDAKTGSYKGTL